MVSQLMFKIIHDEDNGNKSFLKGLAQNLNSDMKA